MADVAFDPDKYLASKQQQAPLPPAGTPFDPDAYLKSKMQDAAPEEERSWYDISGRGLLKSSIEALPIAGMVAGGALGTAIEPGGGTVLGAGAGGGVGGYLKGLAHKYIYGEDNLPLVEGGKEIVPGMIGEMASPAAGQAFSDVKLGMKTLAQTQAVKAAGGMLRDFRALFNKNQIEQIGQYALDEGIVSPGDTLESIAQKANQKNEEAGNALSRIYSLAKEEIAKKNSFRAKLGLVYEAPMEKYAVETGPVGQPTIELRNAPPEAPIMGTKTGGVSESVPVINEPVVGKPIFPEEEDKIYQLPLGSDESNFFGKGFNPVRDKNSILEFARSKLGDSVKGQKALRNLSRYLDELGDKYGDNVLDPRRANNIKGEMDKVVNYNRSALMKEPEIETAYHAARQHVQNLIEEHIDAIGKAIDNPELADSLREANAAYGNSKTIKDMAEDKINRENANRIVGLTDTIVGGAGLGLGGLIGHAIGGPVGGGEGAVIGGLIGAGANKLGRKYGPGLISTGANALSKQDIVPYAKTIAPLMLQSLLRTKNKENE